MGGQKAKVKEVKENSLKRN